jgi:uncharacterized protein (TIGR00290 family)
MATTLAAAEFHGVDHVAFGDLFLTDVRSYREERLRRVGKSAVFPLWGRDTQMLAEQMISVGLRAIVVCIDPRVLAPSFAGRAFDSSFLSDLPAGIDPCGENGEFHTFVHDGPLFAAAIQCRVGDVVSREGFIFADVLPDGDAQ